MADTREKIKDTSGTAPRKPDTPGDQGKGGTQVASERTKEATSGVAGAVKEKGEDLAAGASQLAGKLKDTAEECASSVGGLAVQAKDKAQEVAGAAADKVGTVGQEITDLIRRYPLPALLVGVGVGFLLANLLRRTSSATQ
jgi:hypothetical protein